MLKFISKCCVYMENGTFWFCNQYPKCQFVCTEEESYLYERAIHAFLAVNHVLPQCCVLEDPNDAQNPDKPRECFKCSKKMIDVNTSNGEMRS